MEVHVAGGVTESGRAKITVAAAVGAGDLKTLGGIQKYPRAIHVNSDGNIVGQLIDDTVDGTFTVKEGSEIHERFKSITSASATGLVIF